MTLLDRYNNALGGKYGEQDSVDDMPYLFEYSCKCSHITEMGVRWVNTTWIFLYALSCSVQDNLRLVCYDTEYHPRIEEAKIEATENHISFEFIQENTLNVDIEETDFLFIDTWHTYKHLTMELARHSSKVRKYLAIHDTGGKYALKEDWEYNHPEYGTGDPKKYGMVAAVNDFLHSHVGEWGVECQYHTRSGLTILQRLSNGV